MELQILYPSVPLHRRRIERFLAMNGLRCDDIDYYAVLVDEATGDIVAGGGLKLDVIKCVAVADAHKGEAVANTIVSHLIAHANSEGYQCVKLYTKPQNRRLFESLSFRLLAEAPEAILMETGIGGIGKYCDELRGKSGESITTLRHIATPRRLMQSGVIIMNANPFTLGHRYLIEQSSELVERLYVVVVREDCSVFSYNERKAMVSQGTRDLGNVVVVDGSDYAVSKTTFPTYFLKRLDDASDTQMLLDIDLYRRYIAPSLGATVRFVGSEPSDALTRRYNELMHRMLPDVREIARLEIDGTPVSASRVRQAIDDNRMWDAARLVPSTTLPYIISHLATRALQAELDTTPKPGLVDLYDNGSHRDMDHALMQRSIRVLQPYFTRLATLGLATPNPTHADIAGIGIEAERAMLAATGGVNTHKGALFSLGLAVVAAAMTGRGGAPPPAHPSALNIVRESTTDDSKLSQAIASLARLFPDTHGTHGSTAKEKAGAEAETKSVTKFGAKPMTRVKAIPMSGAGRPLSQLCGALDNARGGYWQLFSDWLPFYEHRLAIGDPCALHKTLLRIMCALDDTNIVYRTSLATMLRVKAEARQLLARYDGVGDEAAFKADLEVMNRDFKAQNISPGGSADMLSLVVFLHSVWRKQ